ncbi:MAG TPA: cobyrinate a,c-diamide synthase [Trichocoleus sp.]
MGGLIIAGERSGAGKTTVTLALLAALSQKSQRVQSFKVGPDYIDPMFHHFVTGRPCYNLDPVLASEDYVQQSFAEHSQNAEYSLVEGVMGLFDGASGRDDFASTAHIARLLNRPVLLVVDCSRMSRSVAALVHGYRSFDPRLRFAGVVLNRVGSDRHLELLRAALEPLNLPILGVLRRQDSITIPDRHLGLVPTAELLELRQIVERLAALGQQCFDWEQLEPLLRAKISGQSSSQLSKSAPIIQDASPRVRIAIARDAAFSFYYPDNLEILTQLGADLIPWSPLNDASLPEKIQGLYLGGGFPEVFAEGLAANQLMRQQIQRLIETGVPTYAECGGLMYLCQSITDFTGHTWPMLGILPTAVTMGKRLTLGYRQAVALQDSPAVEREMTVWGHEFHRSSLTGLPNQPLYKLHSYDAKPLADPEGWQVHQVHASYVHLHWGAQPAVAARFVRQCALQKPL